MIAVTGRPIGHLLFVGKPVTDATNLTGVFNIAFDAPNARRLNIRYAASVGVPVPPEPLQLANNTAGEALGIGLRRAGFSLEPRRLPVEIIVVDSIDRSPSENYLAVSARLGDRWARDRRGLGRGGEGVAILH